MTDISDAPELAPEPDPVAFVAVPVPEGLPDDVKNGEIIPGEVNPATATADVTEGEPA